ncbi:hypothetical protein IKN40_05925 [bacterium]|nr:hypothetical protein [bacterium]
MFSGFSVSAELCSCSTDFSVVLFSCFDGLIVDPHQADGVICISTYLP